MLIRVRVKEGFVGETEMEIKSVRNLVSNSEVKDKGVYLRVIGFWS